MRSKSNDYVTSLSRKKPHNRNDKEQLTFTERERDEISVTGGRETEKLDQ